MLRPHLAAPGLLAVLLLLAPTGGAAHAGVILYNNLAGVTIDGNRINVAGLADSFSTGTSPVNLTDVMVRLFLISPPQGSITVSLLSDNATKPGTPLTPIGTLSDTSISTSLANYDFPLATSISLAANTRYWIELSSTNNSNAFWAFSGDTTGTGVAGQFYAIGSNVIANNGNDPFQMEVSATPAVSAVPEPATFWLLGASLAGLMGRCWLRRKNAACGRTSPDDSADFRQGFSVPLG
jgi:hypothetical protein